MVMALAALAVTLAVTSCASPGSGAGTPPRTVVLPRQVFAPYFEAYNTSAGGPAALSVKSGTKYLSLAFLRTAKTGSCRAYWNGYASEPISSSGFGSAISAIQAAGGNVIPSFGGWAADTSGTELADSCPSVSAIAQVYEQVITTYHVPRIDLDVEGTSLTNTAGINRRNQAIALVESWAAARKLSIQFSYTLPVLNTGLDPAGEAVIRNAIADHARISVVNLMTFDYYLGTEQNMLTDTETAAADSYTELHSLLPSEAPAQIWHMIGVTEMPGIDDFGRDETFTMANAAALRSWAQSKGIGTLSFWALQRDNGGCPGSRGAGTCSGIVQPAWYFSHVFGHFTS
jgi:hypothetical protein